MRILIRNATRAAAVISLSAASAGAQAHWTLKESLRIGSDDAGPGLFGAIYSVQVDAQGRILVYDRTTQDIRMFGRDGKFVRTFGRKGSGPGELRDSEGIVIAPDGSIWARDAANARFTVFDSAGKYRAQWTAHFCWSQGFWRALPDRKGRLVDYDCVVQGGRANGYDLVAYRTDMSRVDTLGPRPECGSRELAEAGTWITKIARGMRYQSIPWAPSAISAIASTGLFWCVPNSSRYEILGIGPGSRDTVRIRRDARPEPVTAFERDSVIALFEAKGSTGLDFTRIPKEKPAIDRLMLDDQERLWVRRTEPGSSIAFDVFDRNGTMLATATLGVVNSSTYQPYVFHGDALYLTILNEDDSPRVVRYDIRR